MCTGGGRNESEKPFDVIHINTLFPDSLLMIAAARIMGWKVICYAHSTMEDFCGSFPFSDRLAPLFRCYITFFYNLADVVITPTAYSRDLVLGYGVRRPVFVLSNGVDMIRFRHDDERAAAFRRRYGTRTVVTAALPIERKGILDFIALARRMEDVRFIWFGSLRAPLIPSRIRRAIRSARRRMCFSLGFVSQDELISAYSGAGCFLFMSHEETEGIAVLEALSCAVPVVLRDIPVYRQLASGGAGPHLFASLDECEALVRAALCGKNEDDPAAGRRIAEERDLRLIGKALTEIHRSLRGKD